MFVVVFSFRSCAIISTNIIHNCSIRYMARCGICYSLIVSVSYLLKTARIYLGNWEVSLTKRMEAYRKLTGTLLSKRVAWAYRKVESSILVINMQYFAVCGCSIQYMHVWWNGNEKLIVHPMLPIEAAVVNWKKLIYCKCGHIGGRLNCGTYLHLGCYVVKRGRNGGHRWP